MAPIRPHLRASNVTEQQWRVLRVLADNGSMDISTIAVTALLYKPTVTRILKELESRDLVRRLVDSGDARRTIITITEEGRNLVANTASYTRRLLEGYRQAFGDERLDAFIAEAHALVDALDRFQNKS